MKRLRMTSFVALPTTTMFSNQSITEFKRAPIDPMPVIRICSATL